MKRFDSRLTALIEGIPKVELHVHFEGSIPPEHCYRLAKAKGIDVPGLLGTPDDVDDPLRYEFANFDEFIPLYLGITACLDDAKAIASSIESVGESLAAQGVRYVEMTVTPMTHIQRGVGREQFLAGLEDGRQRARERHDLEIAWIFDIVRCFPEQAPGAVELALACRDQGVIGLGIGGPEGPEYPIDALAKAFAIARSEQLHRVPHAGEMAGPSAIWQAIEVFHAERIGHGIHCLGDRKLLDYLIEEQIFLEVCPSSNLRLSGILSLEEHPIEKLWQLGVPLSLASDDPPLFSTTLNREYLICAEQFHWGARRVLEVAQAAVKQSFLPDAEKQRLLAEQVVFAEPFFSTPA